MAAHRLYWSHEIGRSIIKEITARWSGIGLGDLLPAAVFPLVLCFTAQRLENLDVRRRLAILVAFLVGTAATLTDYTLEM